MALFGRAPRSAGRKTAAAAALLAVPLLSPAPPAAAQSPAGGKLYGGVGVTVADFDSAHEGIGFGDTPHGLQLYGGLQAHELAAVELAIDRLDGIEPGDLPGSGVERLRISARHTTVTLRGVFGVSLREVLRSRPNLTVLATIGLARSLEERDVLELTTLERTSASDRDTAFVLGAGVTFELERLRIRTFVQSADYGERRLNGVGAAAEFRF